MTWRSQMSLLPAQHGHVSRLQALLALLDVELDPLSFFQVPEAIATDCREVDKDVSAFLPLNKPIALRPIKPLDGSSFSFCHFPTFHYLFVRKKVLPAVAVKKAPRLVSLGAHLRSNQNLTSSYGQIVSYLFIFVKSLQACVKSQITRPESPLPPLSPEQGIFNSISRWFALKGGCGIMNQEMPHRPRVPGKTAGSCRLLLAGSLDRQCLPSVTCGRRCLVDSRRPTSLPAENCDLVE